MMKIGTVASKGIAVGKVITLDRPVLNIPKEKSPDATEEKNQFQEAIERSVENLNAIKAKMADHFDEEHMAIMDAHLQMLQDPEIKSQTHAMIDEGHNVAHAYETVTNNFVVMFEAMEDEYFKARAADIKDIQYRVLAHLVGTPLKDATLLEEDTLVAAHDLTPSDTATLDYRYVKGFITEVGGVTSHTAIMARALGIPALVGAKGVLEKLASDTVYVLDALEGQLIENPSSDTLKEYQVKAQALEAEKVRLQKYKNEPTKTADGHALPLFANIGSPDDLTLVEPHGAEGIGLYRTEFLFMNEKTMPSLETQVAAYKKVFEAYDTVIVRTLDIGGDKNLPYLKQAKEDNPFLGLRALRLTLKEVDLFKTQLKALLLGGVNSPHIHIMFPMVALESELDAAIAVLEDVKKELDDAQEAYQKNVKIGIMIEIPAAALNAERLAQKVDFFSIGSNDLIQYTYAADRMNEAVGYLYQPYDPTLLRLIKHVIDHAHKHDVEVGVCGEMGGDLNLALVLAGLGIDELSMQPSSILPIREALASFNLEDLKALSENVCACHNSEEVKKVIEKALAALN